MPDRALRLGRVSVVVVTFLLPRTPFGRYIYAIGNREARGLSVRHQHPPRASSAPSRICGCCAGLAGVLLAGYSKAYQGMGDAYLLPAIAAVVIGGTNILGGRALPRHRRRRHPDRPAQLVLSVMQMPEAGRQIIYGVVIIAMLLVYGRGARVTG